MSNVQDLPPRVGFLDGHRFTGCENKTRWPIAFCEAASSMWAFGRS